MTPERKEAWRTYLTARLLEFGAGPAEDWSSKPHLYNVWPLKDTGFGPGERTLVKTWLLDDCEGITEAGLKFIRGEEDDA